MGWRGAMRSIGATVRAAERDARRRQKELERQEREYEKMLELDRAAHEVEVHENYIERIISIHKDCSSHINWQSLADAPEPEEPGRLSVSETEAREKMASYKVGFFDRLFKREAGLREKLQHDIEYAKIVDEKLHNRLLNKFQETHEDWADSQKFSERILAGNAQAYVEAIEEINPFQEISTLGSGVSFEFEKPEIVSAIVKIHGKEVIPRETKGLLKSGRLSLKQTPKGKFYELYQDYVCSSILRIAGELFSLLPVEVAIVTAKDDLLNTRTGHLEEQAILSVAIPRATFEGLDLEFIDPSDSMENFVHRMNFKKTSGFSAVEAVAVSDVKLP